MDKKSYNIYLCVTTTDRSDWRGQIKDLNKLKEDTASVFPTCLEPDEREEMYNLLLSSNVKNIPHVHLRDDMTEEEADFFIKNFRTEAFTVHTDFFEKSSGWKIAKKLFVEFRFSESNFDLDSIKKIGGLCVDFAHFYRAKKLGLPEYDYTIKGAERFVVGINHLNGIINGNEDSHFISDLRDFDYLKEVPEKLFSSYVCMEMENSIEEQIKFRNYLRKKLKEWRRVG